MTDHTAILADYAAGEKVSVITMTHNCSASTVCRLAGRAGISRSPRREPSDRDREIGAAFAAGGAVAEIARAYDITRQRVYQIADSLGLPRRARTAR